MTIYYVDTKLGSDANNGSSWALAWKTTEPLKAIYTGTSISDVEIRFAKTPAIAATVPQTTPQINNHDTTRIQGLSKMYPNTSSWSLTSFGWVMVSPFTTAGNFDLSMAGLCQITCPAGSNGKAAYMDLVTTISLTGKYGIEVWCYTTESTTTASLSLCSDTTGDVILKTYALPAPVSALTATTWAYPVLVGVGDLPTNVLSLRINCVNPGGASTTFWIGMTSVVLDKEATGYIGANGVYISNADQMYYPPICYFGAYYSGTGANPNRLFSNRYATGPTDAALSHTFYPLYSTYRPQATLPASVVTVGTSALPVKFIGGWNTTTTVVDGVTCLDTFNLSLAPSTVTSLSVWVKNFILMKSGVILYASNASLTVPSVVVDNVILPTGGLDVKNGDLALLPGMSRLIYSTTFAPTVAEEIRVSNSSFFNSYGIFVNRPKGVTFSTDVLNTNCYMWKSVLGYTISTTRYGVGDPYAYEACTFAYQLAVPIGSSHACTFTNPPAAPVLSGPVTAPYARTVNASCVGHLVVPGGAFTFIDNPHIEHSANDQRSLKLASYASTVIANIQPHTPASSGWTGGALVLVDASLAGAMLVMADCDMTVNFDSILVSASTPISVKNCTFTLYGRSGTTAFNFQTETASNFVNLESITLAGGWGYGIGLGGGKVAVKNLTCSHASTIPVNFPSTGGPVGIPTLSNEANFNLSGVTSVNSTVVQHPAFTNSMVGVASIEGSNIADADGRYTPYCTLKKDDTIKILGTPSWKMALRTSVGARHYTEVMVGSFYVTAGALVTAMVTCRRSSQHCRSWLSVRPLSTMDPTFTDITVVQDVAILSWEEISLSFTPLIQGTVEVYIATTGLSGTSSWFDKFKFFQA